MNSNRIIVEQEKILWLLGINHRSRNKKKNTKRSNPGIEKERQNYWLDEQCWWPESLKWSSTRKEKTSNNRVDTINLTWTSRKASFILIQYGALIEFENNPNKTSLMNRWNSDDDRRKLFPTFHCSFNVNLNIIWTQMFSSSFILFDL